MWLWRLGIGLSGTEWKVAEWQRDTARPWHATTERGGHSG
ncbi:hypothetical protein CLV40_12338 [Actinokineospora auranticolor]|uniref:Uncharacterized protein n=1 Tax=Actinokineospora auranticolor TaxID=155976 RepID=A0A2S6GFD3_9PSEU|nr:hypothetical protein CLV40_12338 [Actinokineospora auranticolor]